MRKLLAARVRHLQELASKGGMSVANKALCLSTLNVAAVPHPPQPPPPHAHACAALNETRDQGPMHAKTHDPRQEMRQSVCFLKARVAQGRQSGDSVLSDAGGGREQRCGRRLRIREAHQRS